MAVEIEHKFLVDTTRWTPQGAGVPYRQGYLSLTKERIVRVRVAGDRAFLTIKGLTEGIARAEFEYPIPLADAEEMLRALCEKPLIEKTRHTELWHGRRWEIDVFHGDNEGLVIAEVEVASADEKIVKPDWATTDVSNDGRYFNNNLAARPYRLWRGV
jgi:adenylate cyclase